jgi:hypothetical protein
MERVAISSDIVCQIQSLSAQTVHRIAERGRFFGTKANRRNRRNPHVDWLANPGKSEHRWVETVALAQLT